MVLQSVRRAAQDPSRHSRSQQPFSGYSLGQGGAWQTCARGKRALEDLLVGAKEITPEQIFPILEDHTPAADDELPDTGVGLELERVLSAAFIRTQYYGTRSSTVLLVERTGNLTFVERSFNPRDKSQNETRYEFRIDFNVY